MYDTTKIKTLGIAIGKIIGAIAALFLGGLFIFVTWRAIATTFDLPTFSYWICVCATGALATICHFLGKIFSGIGNKKGNEEGD